MQFEYIKSFDFSEIGNWPNEKYYFSPIPEKIEPIPQPINVYFPVYGNPSIDYGIYSKNTLIDYEYGNIFKDYNSDKHKYSLNLFSDTTPLSFYYMPNHRDLYPYTIFNVFGIESDQIIKGFFLNPKRLFFKPIYTEKSSIGWRIQLSAIILGQDPTYFQSNDFIKDALSVYKYDRESYDNKKEYALPTNLTLKYDIKGTEKFFNKNIINFTNTYNPSSLDINLEEAGTEIKKNSIYFTNKHYLLNTDTIIGETSYYNDEDNDFFNFNGYNYNFNNDNDVQKYYMFNNPSDINDEWLYIRLTPSNAQLEYFCNTEKITGVPDTALSIKYISDSDKIKNKSENAIDTILIFEKNSEITSIDQEFSSENSDNIILDLKYPPHYYNYNLKYKAFLDFYNLSSVLTFEGTNNESIYQQIYDYFNDPSFIDDRYSKFAYEINSIDDSFYKSTGILLSAVSSYSIYTLNEIVFLSAYSVNEITNTLLELSGNYSEIISNINIEIDINTFKTKGLVLSGTPEFSDYKYLTASSFDSLTSIIFDLGFYDLNSTIYEYGYYNEINVNDNIYRATGIYNKSVEFYNDTFVQEISTYNNVSHVLNNSITVTASDVQTLTSAIYDLGEPYSQIAESLYPLNHIGEYITTGILLSGDWVCVDQKTAIGSDYYELTASANSFGGIYSIYAETTAKIDFLNEFKSTGAYLDGVTYKNILSSFVFQEASPTTYYNKISTFDVKINALYNITISSYNENITDISFLYNTISVFNIDNRLYDNFVEGYSLNYDLTSKIVDYDTEYVKLSTYLFSDYHLSILDLETYGELDLIKYEFLNLSDNLKSVLSCYYGEDKIPYNLYNTDWVPATSGCVLYIEYPNNPFGEVSFEIVPKLSTYSGFLDSYYKTKIVLAQNYTNNSLEFTKIVVNNKNEKSNHIEVELLSLADDLEGTNIKWLIEPDIENVVLYVKNPETEEITYIQKNENIVYNKNYTSTVYISGYTNNEIKISGESEKYNQQSEVKTNLELFNIFQDSSFKIAPLMELDNLRQIRNIDVAAYLMQSNTLIDIPDGFSIYWIWQYGDLVDSQIQPITAVKDDGKIYSCGETDTIQNLSSLSFFIRPNLNYGPIENIVKVKAFTFNEKHNFNTEYDIIVDDYPIKNLYDLNIETYYDLYPNDVIHNTINSPSFTRPLNDFSVYTFKIDKSETSIFKFLSSYENITWEFFDDYGFYQKITGVPEFDKYEVYNSLNWNLNYIKLTIDNVKLPTWDSPHTFTKILNINSLPESDFYSPLKFIIYPEYYWTPENPYINFTNEENFIYSVQPVTYGNKKTETYNFYVSANKEAKLYEFSTGDVLETNQGLLKIPESLELKSEFGLPITLSAFDDVYFPIENGIFYKIASFEGLDDYFMDNLVFTTIAFNGEVTEYMDNFTKSPKIIPFDTFNFTFSSVFSSINIQNERILVVDQFILPNYKQSPVKLLDGLSTVVYTLSTKYWTAVKEIEAKTGRYNIFELIVGNPLEPLTISNKKTDILYLFAEARITKSILPDTFINYPSYEDKEQWKTMDETVEAKILDDAFIQENII
jgi:hypothetical protein